MIRLVHHGERKTGVRGEDPLAEARLRGKRRMGEILEAEGGSVGATEAAAIMGVSERALEQRRRGGTVLALPVGDGSHAFPRWQFDGDAQDGLVPGLPRVLQSFSVTSPWMQAEFMLAPEDRLADRSPLDALKAGEIDAMAQAASAYGEHGAY